MVGICRRGSRIYADAAIPSPGAVEAQARPCTIRDVLGLAREGKCLLTSIGLGEKAVYILLSGNDRYSAACILASRELRHICVLLPTSREALLPHVQLLTGISVVLHVRGGQINKVDTACDQNKLATSWWDESWSADSGCVCMLTSGSTGAPKVVVSSWDAMGLQAEVTARALITSSCSHIVCASSIAHAYALNAVISAHTAARDGKKVILSIAASPDEAKVLLAQACEVPRVVFGTPGVWAQLVDAPVIEPVFLAFSAGVAMPCDLHQLLWRRHRLDVRQNYGTTETGNIAYQAARDVGDIGAFGTTSSSLPGSHALLDVGMLWPGVTATSMPPLDAMLLDEGEHGELCVSTPWQSLGFVDMRNSQRGLHRLGSYHRTGDAACLLSAEGDGNVASGTAVRVGHRLRQPICIALEGVEHFIHPHLLERLACEHPAVVDALVPTRSRPAEELEVLVVLEEGSSCTESEIVEWPLWSTQVPCGLEFHVRIVPFLQCSPAGKLLYCQ